MGRADKRRVIEAQLFGSHQRKINLGLDGVTDPVLEQRIADLGEALRVLGGDPDEIRAEVANRHRDRFSSVQSMSVADQAAELRSRSRSN
ncbi:MAG: hypothetical protein ACRBI6_16090 [Acidimicrobiales bacterium]